MLKQKLRKNKNQMKINAIFLFLIISNIVLVVGLLYYYSKTQINIEFETIDNLLTIIATVIILGFITTRLPQLREKGGSLYDIVYLIIIAIIGLMDSYFNSNVNTPLLFGEYLDMFKVLSVILIFILLSTKLRFFKEILNGKLTKKNLLICAIIFTALGLLASHLHINVNNTPANVRCMVVMISGLFGGPYVGIPVGIISGAYRYTLGGITALPCAVSTVISGVIGSLIFIWNDKKFPRTIAAIMLMFLYIGFEMLMIVIASPPEISFPYIRTIYPVMLFASVVGIILFAIVIREERQKGNTEVSYEELKIRELENQLEEYDEKIEDLRKEIRDMKKSNGSEEEK